MIKTKSVKDLYVKELLRIERKYGVLEAKDVVEEARDPKNPLHRYFQWNDVRAAVEWRTHQARMLITTIKVIINGTQKDAFYNCRVVINKKKTQGYFSVQRVMRSKNLQGAVLREAVQNLKYWQKKYQEIKDLNGVINEEKLKEIETALN